MASIAIPATVTAASSCQMIREAFASLGHTAAGLGQIRPEQR